MQLLRRWINGPWVPPQVGRAPYLWISTLVFFGWKYLYVDAYALEYALLALTLLAFVPIYLGSFWYSGRDTAPFIAVSFAMGAAWAPFNFGASCFFVFLPQPCVRVSARRASHTAAWPPSWSPPPAWRWP